MERIMAIADDDDQTVVTTTGIHVARRIGESLCHSYQGQFASHLWRRRGFHPRHAGLAEKDPVYRFFSTSPPVSGTKRTGTMLLLANPRGVFTHCSSSW